MKKWIFIGPLAILVIWSAITFTELVNTLFIPTPWTVVKEFFRLIFTGAIFADLLRTLYRMVVGFGIAVAFGIPLGILMGSSNRVYAALEFIVDFFRSLPAMALLPALMLLLGIGDASKVAIIVIGASLIILVETIHSVKNCRKTRILVAKTMRASQFQIFSSVVFPEALPGIFGGLRVSLSVALVLTVVSEMFIGTNYGLGHRIINAQLMYHTATMYSVIFLVGLLGYGLNKGTSSLEKKVVHWAGK